MKKRKLLGVAAAFLTMLLFGACGVDQSFMLLYYSLGGAVSSKAGADFTEPPFVDYTVCRLHCGSLP